MTIAVSTSYAESTSFWLELKHAWYDIFTPNDYYMPIVNEELDISQKGLIRKFSFKHKYDRAYTAGIILKKFGSGDIFFESISKRYKTTLHLKINYYIDNVLVLSKTVRNEYSPFVGLRGNGLILVYYRCPDELPPNKEIICEVEVVEPDKYLYDNFGPARFYISKLSDK